MTSIEDLRLKYFEDCKEILEELLNIDNESELINHKSRLDTLIEKIAFLKHLQLNAEAFAEPISIEQVSPEDELVLENASLTAASDSSGTEASQFSFAMSGSILTETTEQGYLEDEALEEDYLGEDEVSQSEQFNEQAPLEDLEEEVVFENDHEDELAELNFENQTELVNEAELGLELNPLQSEPEQTPELEPQTETVEELFQAAPQEHSHRNEKKFKLAHIKGLSATVNSLFDEELLDTSKDEGQEVLTSEENRSARDSQESPKQRTHFKLDLNDRIAFSKILFDGSQSELNHTVNELNEFQELALAKDYLSQVYHKRDWKKADEYAQRLWMLVEAKFQ